MTRKSLSAQLRRERDAIQTAKPFGGICPSCDLFRAPREFERDNETRYVNCSSCRGKGKGDEWREK